MLTLYLSMLPFPITGSFAGKAKSECKEGKLWGKK